MRPLLILFILVAGSNGPARSQETAPSGLLFQSLPEGCTVGVASGRITRDGRPLLWKNKDNDFAATPTEPYIYQVDYDTSEAIAFICLNRFESGPTFDGVNEEGFAIAFASSDDLAKPGIPTNNTGFIRFALGRCRTVFDFKHILDSTNITGRTTAGNFGVMDRLGGAAIFEISSDAYWWYDANDTANADGYVIRTNFSLQGGGTLGKERYDRSRELVGTICAGDSLDAQCMIRYHMRDLNQYGKPFAMPYYTSMFYPQVPHWYLYTYGFVLNSLTTAAVVMEGVLPGEDPRLTTMWTSLGFPGTSIVVPFWPVCEPPASARGDESSPLSLASKSLRNEVMDVYTVTQYPGYQLEFLNTYKLCDTLGGGLWPYLFDAEHSVIAAAEISLEAWRGMGDWLSTEMIEGKESELAAIALDKLQGAMGVVAVRGGEPPATPAAFALLQNYPNPFNPSTVISFQLPIASYVSLKVFDLLGREMAVLVDEQQSAGAHSATWNAQGMASGMYFYRLETTGTDGMKKVSTRKMTLMK